MPAVLANNSPRTHNYISKPWLVVSDLNQYTTITLLVNFNGWYIDNPAHMHLPISMT